MSLFLIADFSPWSLRRVCDIQRKFCLDELLNLANAGEVIIWVVFDQIGEDQVVRPTV